MTHINLAGQWVSTYSYHDGQDLSSHTVTFEGDIDLVGRSLPQADGSELTLRLRYDPTTRTLTGIFKEATSPSGHFKGAVFHGALQFIVNPTGDRAEGKWVGYNSDMTRVNAGEWTLERNSRNQ